MYQTVKLLYCFGIFITFALQFFVPVEILVLPAVARVSDGWKKPVDLLLRTLLVIFTCEWRQLHQVALWAAARGSKHGAPLFPTCSSSDGACV